MAWPPSHPGDSDHTTVKAAAEAIDAIDRDRQRVGPAKHARQHSRDLAEMRKMSYRGLIGSKNSSFDALPYERGL